MDQITKEANLDHEALNELRGSLFADDQSLINSDKLELQDHTNSLNTSYEKYGTRSSTARTEVMTVSRKPEQLDININGAQLKQTTELKYLGIFCQPSPTSARHGSSLKAWRES